jgi:hypothetical protein
MAENLWNLNWKVPDTPAARNRPLSSAANRTPPLQNPPQLSVGAAFPEPNLDPTRFYSAPIQFGTIRTPAAPFSLKVMASL